MTAVRPGMRVRDRDGNDVGWVERVQVRASPGREGATSLMQVFSDVLAGAPAHASGDQGLSVRIVGGGHQGGWWAGPLDIDHVGDEALFLAVSWDCLPEPNG